MNEPTGVIHKDTPTLVFVGGFLLAVGGEEPSEGVAMEVIHRDLGSWKQVVSLKCMLLLSVDGFGASWRSLLSLFGVLTGGAHGSMVEFGCC